MGYTDYSWAPSPGTDGIFIVLSDSFGLPKNAPNRDNAISFLKVVGSRGEGQDAFNPIKGSIPARRRRPKPLRRVPTHCDGGLCNQYARSEHPARRRPSKASFLTTTSLSTRLLPTGTLPRDRLCSSKRRRTQDLANRTYPTVRVEGERGLAASPATRKRRRPGWLRGEMLIALIVLAPSIFLVAIFIYGFIGWTFYISTVKWDSAVVDYTFVGLKNWQRLFNDARFHSDLRNHLLYAIGFMSQCIVFGFLLAVLLDLRTLAGRRFSARYSFFPCCFGYRDRRRLAMVDAAYDRDQPSLPPSV